MRIIKMMGWRDQYAVGRMCFLDLLRSQADFFFVGKSAWDESLYGTTRVDKSKSVELLYVVIAEVRPKFASSLHVN